MDLGWTAGCLRPVQRSSIWPPGVRGAACGCAEPQKSPQSLFCGGNGFSASDGNGEMMRSLVFEAFCTPRLALTSARASPVTCRRFHRPCEEVVGANENVQDERTGLSNIVVRMRNLAHHAHRCALGRCSGTLSLWCSEPLHRRASLPPFFRFAS